MCRFNDLYIKQVEWQSLISIHLMCRFNVALAMVQGKPTTDFNTSHVSVQCSFFDGLLL